MPDKLTPTMVFDDKLLNGILKRLYYSDCPYEFSILPAELLRHVYERFLGSTIRLSKQSPCTRRRET